MSCEAEFAYSTHCASEPATILILHHCFVPVGRGRTDQKALSHTVVSGAVGPESPAFLDHTVRGQDREGG